MLKSRLFIIVQHYTPKLLLSKFAGVLANCQISWIKNFFIRTFIKLYDVDLSTAIYADPTKYPSFNAFFTRKLKLGSRKIPNVVTEIISPVDGIIYQYGDIIENQLLQAKNRYFKLIDLLGGYKNIARHFIQQKFISIYLAPKQYHRVHMPYSGKLLKMIFVPGKLFSVNQVTVNNVQDLFAQNERLICVFDTQHGPLCVIMVGAMLVGSIHTSWYGQITRSKVIQEWDYSDTFIYLSKGDELGYFSMGSTVILLFNEKSIWTELVHSESALKMGEAIANYL